MKQQLCEVCLTLATNTFWELYHQELDNDGRPAIICWYHICDRCTPIRTCGEGPMGIVPRVVKTENELHDIILTWMDGDDEVTRTETQKAK